MSKININNIFTIGYRCNSDDFLEKILKIRKYSSPFSYMVIDIKTALFFIHNNFENYLNKDNIFKGNNTFLFNKKKWICDYMYIHKISEIENEYVDILHDVNKVCIWNHHNLDNESIINSFKIRSSHLMHILTKEPSTMLLFYIEKIQEYDENKLYFDIDLLNKYNCKFLLLIPMLNYNSEPSIIYNDTKNIIIYFNSNLDLFGTEIHSHIEEWDKLKLIINNLYNFDIMDRAHYAL